MESPLNEPRIFDEAVFKRLFASLPREQASAFVRILTERADTLLGKLRGIDGAVAVDQALGEEAHVLAGSGGLFGFMEMGRLAREFEYAVQTGAADVDRAAKLLAGGIEASLIEMRRHYG